MVATAEDARSFLRDNYGSRASDPVYLAAGAWSQCYAFELDGEECVARFGVHGEDFAKDAYAAGYAAEGLPIPRTIAWGFTSAGYYAISERVHGTALERVAPQERQATLASLGQLLDALADADVARITGFGLWAGDGQGQSPSWRAFLLEVDKDHPHRRTFGWRRMLDAHPDRARLFDSEFARLRRLVDACQEERRLVHADLINDNVFVEGGAVSGVFDWGCSLYGDSLYDDAWLAFWAPWHHALKDVDFIDLAATRLVKRGQVVTDLTDRAKCYFVHIGLDNLAYCASVGRWDDFDATARRMRELAAR